MGKDRDAIHNKKDLFSPVQGSQHKDNPRHIDPAKGELCNI